MTAAVRLVTGDVGGPMDEEMLAAFGLQVEQQEAGGIEAWPENETTIKVFMAMGTQWNVGMAGAVGLRYEALPVVLDLMGVAADERPGVFAGLRVMEGAALGEIARGR
jgi:hypothetical protein